ncbi:MAG: DUF488 family protein [Acidimicrobiales bacterium]
MNGHKPGRESDDSALRSPDDPFALLSIGHSNASLESVIELLKTNDVEVVADVRSYPRSRYVPHFDALALRHALGVQGIAYVAMGEQLGGRPRGDTFYDPEGHVRYDRLAEAESFTAGVDRLLTGARQYRIAMLCSEEDPAGCHRHLLIGVVLATKGVEVGHIRHDGRVQPEGTLPSPLDPPGDRIANLFASENPGWRSLRSVSLNGAHNRSSAR